MMCLNGYFVRNISLCLACVRLVVVCGTVCLGHVRDL